MIRGKADFLIFLFILILLSSCSGEKDSSISIEYWTHEDGSRRALEERLISSFESEHPEIEVIRTEYGSSELLAMIVSAFEADEGPDLFNLPSEEISALLYDGKLSELEAGVVGYDSIEELREAYIPAAFETVTLGSSIYGIPLEYTSWCLYVNKGLLREAGLGEEPPATWEELVGMAEKLTEREDGILIRRGFDFRYPFYLSFFVPMVRQLGGDLFGPDGEVIYNDEAWEKALDFMREWGPHGLNLGAPTYINARTLFNSEEIAMCLSGLYQESRMKNQNPYFFESDDWLVAPFPVFENAVTDESASPYFHYFMVNGDSDDKTKEASWMLAGYFAAHAEDYLDEIGLVMPLKRIVESESLRDKPFASVFIGDIERSGKIYSGPNASEIQRLIGVAVESVMLNDVPTEKAVQALRSSIQELESSCTLMVSSR